MRFLRTRTIILAILIASMSLFCVAGNHRPADWIQIQSANFDYYYQEDAKECPEEIARALERLECFYEFAAPVWDYPEGVRIQYYKYPSSEAVHQATGRHVNACAVLNRATVHSINFADAHEVAHLLTTRHLYTPLGTCNLPYFWLEGIAMYYTWPEVYFCNGVNTAEYKECVGIWYGQTVHCHACKMLKDGSLPPITPLIFSDTAFDDLHHKVSYPLAGSFLTFLLGPSHKNVETVKSLKGFFRVINRASSKGQVLLAFEDHFHMSIEEAEEKWHDFLLEWDEEGHQCL